MKHKTTVANIFQWKTLVMWRKNWQSFFRPFWHWLHERFTCDQCPLISQRKQKSELQSLNTYSVNCKEVWCPAIIMNYSHWYLSWSVHWLFLFQVEEIKQCQNCYYMSNAKPKDWFCVPCVSRIYKYFYLARTNVQRAIVVPQCRLQFLPYSQRYPHDLPRMTSLSPTGGWMISYTTCFTRKVIMTSQANTPKPRRTARFL